MPSSRVPAPKTVLAVKSEEECLELLAKELSSIPDREFPGAQNGETWPGNGQPSPTADLSPAPAMDTSTKVMIAKTIRAAMADIRSGS